MLERFLILKNKFKVIKLWSGQNNGLTPKDMFWSKGRKVQ